MPLSHDQIKRIENIYYIKKDIYRPEHTLNDEVKMYETFDDPESFIKKGEILTDVYFQFISKNNITDVTKKRDVDNAISKLSRDIENEILISERIKKSIGAAFESFGRKIIYKLFKKTFRIKNDVYQGTLSTEEHEQLKKLLISNYKF